MSDLPIMVIWPTDIPGLFDGVTPDGQPLTDLTVGQVRSLSAQHGWQVVPGYPTT